MGQRLHAGHGAVMRVGVRNMHVQRQRPAQEIRHAFRVHTGFRTQHDGLARHTLGS